MRTTSVVLHLLAFVTMGILVVMTRGTPAAPWTALAFLCQIVSALCFYLGWRTGEHNTNKP